MITEDDKLETLLADPWIAKKRTRWPISIVIIFLTIFALKPVIVDRLISRAQAYSSNNMFINAERECRKAIYLDQYNTIAWNILGDAYNSQGDIPNAVNTYIDAIKANPANKVAHFRLGKIFALDKFYKKAIIHFELIRILGPESPAALAGDSFSYYQASLEMLLLCYEKLGKTDRMNEIVRELAVLQNRLKNDQMLKTDAAK